jgi:hypothetical protein
VASARHHKAAKGYRLRGSPSADRGRPCQQRAGSARGPLLCVGAAPRVAQPARSGVTALRLGSGGQLPASRSCSPSPPTVRAEACGRTLGSAKGCAIPFGQGLGWLGASPGASSHALGALSASLPVPGRRPGPGKCGSGPAQCFTGRVQGLAEPVRSRTGLVQCLTGRVQSRTGPGQWLAARVRSATWARRVRYWAGPVLYWTHPVAHEARSVRHRIRLVCHWTRPVPHWIRSVAHRRRPVEHRACPVPHRSRPVGHSGPESPSPDRPSASPNASSLSPSAPCAPLGQSSRSPKWPSVSPNAPSASPSPRGSPVSVARLVSGFVQCAPGRTRRDSELVHERTVRVQ